MKKIIFLLVFISLVGYLIGQYVPVEVVNNAEDYLGRQLVTRFRDEIRKSPSYTVTYSSDEPHFKVKIDTMDRYKGDSLYEGISTIYNYTILIAVNGIDIYCYSQLGYAGKDVLNEVAFQIYSDLDEFIETFKSYLIKLLEEYE